MQFAEGVILFYNLAVPVRGKKPLKNVKAVGLPGAISANLFTLGNIILHRHLLMKELYLTRPSTPMVVKRSRLFDQVSSATSFLCISLTLEKEFHKIHCIIVDESYATLV